MSTWAEQRRTDRAAEREQARLDADAAAARRLREMEALASLTRAERAEREQAAERRWGRVAARWKALVGWAAAHAVELLIYPLAVVSAAMAVPAMASYGHDLYGDATGYALPGLSELGQWAFALAVTVSRRRYPDRPTAALTAGVGVFALVAAGLNFAHGLDQGVVTAVVMAVVSVAGVVAHQLVTAAPRRSRAERTARRLQRLAARRVADARAIATRRAVVDLAADGTASLVYAPGRYVPHGNRLERAVVPGLPVAPVDDWEAALSALTVEPIGSAESITEADQQDSAGEPDAGSGGVAVLDPPDPSDPTPPRPSPAHPIDPAARRTLTPEEARDAAWRLARRHGRPVTAEQLRKALRIAPATARALRDQINRELYGETP
jgi:hypothetical protein